MKLRFVNVMHDDGRWGIQRLTMTAMKMNDDVLNLTSLMLTGPANTAATRSLHVSNFLKVTRLKVTVKVKGCRGQRGSR